MWPKHKTGVCVAVSDKPLSNESKLPIDRWFRYSMQINKNP